MIFSILIIFCILLFETMPKTIMVIISLLTSVLYLISTILHSVLFDKEIKINNQFQNDNKIFTRKVNFLYHLCYYYLSIFIIIGLLYLNAFSFSEDNICSKITNYSIILFYVFFLLHYL